MRASRLKLKNWRAIKEADLKLDKINVFSGPGGSGKSSILNALEAAMIGTCDWTDNRGSGLPDNIYEGETSASITLSVEEIGDIMRNIRKGSTSKLQVADYEGPPSKQQKILLEAIGLTKRQVQAIMRSKTFIGMLDADRINILSSALISSDAWKKILSDNIENADEVISAIVEECGKDPGPKDVYEKFYAIRRDTRGKLKQIESMGDDVFPHSAENREHIA